MNNRLCNWLMFALHIAVAAVVIAAVWSSYSSRMDERQRIAQKALEAHDKADARTRDVETKRHILKGLQEDDPYVIEKIAREQYNYSGNNELTPAGR